MGRDVDVDPNSKPRLQSRQTPEEASARAVRRGTESHRDAQHVQTNARTARRGGARACDGYVLAPSDSQMAASTGACARAGDSSAVKKITLKNDESSGRQDRLRLVVCGD